MTERTKPVRKTEAPFRWEDVDVLAYKEEGSAPFKGVTRQVLFGDPALDGELRYFEVAPGGHTTLERHEHAHGVMILRGRGRAMVHPEVREVAEGDLVFIAPMTWHQFQADDDHPLGFLCLVNRERDRPQLPNDADVTSLCETPECAAFLDRSIKARG